LAKIHSFESFGTVDGPGVRFIVFLQGCPLRCLYCHNPDTWNVNGGKEYSAQEVYKEIKKYYNYIKDGGVTISGGEPLLQIDFVIELFKLLKQDQIHTCVDTSGIVFNNNEKIVEKFQTLLQYTDLFLLDIKQIDDLKHRKLTGQSNERVKAFLSFLNEHKKSVWIRYVLVPGYSDKHQDVSNLHEFLKQFQNIEKIEVLPYHTLGVSKYEALNLKYPLEGVSTPSKESIKKTREILGVK